MAGVTKHQWQGDDPEEDPLAPGMSYGMWEKYAPALDFIPRFVPKAFDIHVLLPAARSLLVDPKRDTLILRHILVWSFLHLPFALLVLFYADESRATFALWAVFHFFLWFTAMDTYVLGLHVISHRTVFRKPLAGLFQFWYVAILGPIFGETPETYYVHHIGMHHAFNNYFTDLSSTMTYRRDSKWHFVCYLFRFLFCYPEIAGLFSRRNRKLLARFFTGELCWLAVVVACYAFRPVGTLCVLVAPVLIMRTGMMAGNWGQHAFLNPKEPTTNYGHSVNILSSSYNKRCFNDGYHIMHHLYPSAHYTELPKLFRKDLELLKDHDCVCFKHPHWDFTMLWWYLMRGDYDTLAKHYVDLTGKRSHDEIVSLLKERAQRVYRPEEFDPATKALIRG